MKLQPETKYYLRKWGRVQGFNFFFVFYLENLDLHTGDALRQVHIMKLHTKSNHRRSIMKDFCTRRIWKSIISEFKPFYGGAVYQDIWRRNTQSLLIITLIQTLNLGGFSKSFRSQGTQKIWILETKPEIPYKDQESASHIYLKSASIVDLKI